MFSLRKSSSSRYSYLFGLSLMGQIQFPEGYPNKDNALVYVESESAQAKKAQPLKATIDQKKMTFLPHVTVLTPGSEVTFKNSDPHIHAINVNGGPLNKVQVRIKPASKEKTTFTVKESGVSELLCDIHAQMNAFVVVVNTPYYALSDAKGAFALKDLPPPPFKLKVWHEVLPPKEILIKNEEDLKKAASLKLEAWAS